MPTQVRSLSLPIALACALGTAMTVHAQKAPRHRTVAPAADTSTVSLGSAMNARSIGPAVMSGRVSSIAMDPKDPTTFYVGQGMAGVFKTTDGGSSFTSIFEPDGVASIGDIAIAPSDPNVIWVGTGEANDRNSETWGSGVYRSTDAGKTWTHVGLPDSRVIARIAVHPTDPRTAYVAAVGNLWVPSAERGLYKTTDAGATWKKVLGVAAPYDTRVGAGDVLLDPSNPNIVYAALYARERKAWLFSAGARATDGKDLGGIFKSEDGGATWHKLTVGLPARTGRIGLTIYPKNPNILYAVIQSDEAGMQSPLGAYSRAGGVFRTDDGGAHWVRKSGLNSRAFYFSQIRVDPNNDARVYDLGMPLYVSDDSGATWQENVSDHVHSDLHALVIDPADSRHLLLGTDGGAYQSFSAGKTWDRLNKYAAGEIRRVNVDPSVRGRICFGLQDNDEWVGSTRARGNGGIGNGDWTLLGEGDGSYCAFDPNNPNVVYWTMQQQEYRTNVDSGTSTPLRPEVTEDWPAYPFNWLPPLVGSRHDPDVYYLGSNLVLKLTDHGQHATPISPVLTSGRYARTLSSTGPSGNGWAGYGTITDLAESPVTAGVIWAGTDDGKLWRTADGGAHWTDLSGNLPPEARDHWLNRVEPGHKSADVAYVVVDGHRDGVDAPMAYRTADGGRTWQRISSTLPKGEPVRVVREDPDNPDVLYAGTERRLFLSLDRGQSWQPLGHLPPVAVDDIAIHPIDHDLIIGTQGRSLYVIDQVRPLTQLTPAVLASDAHLFAPEPVVRRNGLPLDDFGGSVFEGKDAPNGAVLTYYVKHDTGKPAKITITRQNGDSVATLTGSAKAGLNRVVWNLIDGFSIRDPGAHGPPQPVKAGAYRVTLTYGSTTQTEQLTVLP